jgi:predicted O-methyltransferase YrrM
VTDHPARFETPPLVQAAQQLAAQAGFERSCTPEVGQLLRILAATVMDGVIAELGAGYGVGAAWLVSGLRPGVRLRTIEHDWARASAVAQLLAAQPAARVDYGDWRELLRAGAEPYALLFVDVHDAKYDPDVVLPCLRPGGLLVLDDLTPSAQWPAEWQGRTDTLRERWLLDPRLLAAEILLTPTSAAIVAALR